MGRIPYCLIGTGPGIMRSVGRIAALDGVRGMAILMVVIAHAWYSWLPSGGKLGVLLFFVLSGFLITTILLREERVDLKRFYWRRAIRLGPALLVFLAFYLLVGFPGYDSEFGLALGGLLYVANWAQVFGGDYGILSHLWSLAVEEQFYLFWPLLLVWLRPRPDRFGVTAFLLAGSVLWRVAAWQLGGGWDWLHKGTDMAAAALLTGCLIAQLRHAGRLPDVSRLQPIAWASFLGLAMWAPSTGAMVAFQFPVATLAAGLAVAGAAQSGMAWLEARVLRFFAVVSYALYIWHVPILRVAQPDVYTDPRPVAALVGVGAAIGVAWLSWTWIERPALAYRDRILIRPPRIASKRRTGRRSPM